MSAKFCYQALTRKPSLGEISPELEPKSWQGLQHEVVGPPAAQMCLLGKLANGTHVLIIKYNALCLLPPRPRLCREQQMYATALSREDQVSNHGRGMSLGRGRKGKLHPRLSSRWKRADLLKALLQWGREGSLLGQRCRLGETPALSSERHAPDLGTVQRVWESRSMQATPPRSRPRS